ncbi:MAG TPA: flavin reductase family protein [Pyrinomonadaceae bacterium]|jgi:flavin reductase (DIM6/NTAB) family NADH-FMN oxidoreductase RutF|nr:flavin reductase family protein [Pyrinomonadaceae bacterium]
MSVTQEQFRAALGSFASGVTVVTTRDANGKLLGITVSAFCSVSLDPPMVLICIEKTAGSHYAFEESNVFVVNVLREGESAMSERFASQDEDKFIGVNFKPGIDGVPVLSDALAVLECRVKFSYHGGDHSIFIGEVENVLLDNGKPLLYFRSHYGRFEKD